MRGHLMLNFSGTYEAENFRDGEILDFSELDGTCCYCEDQAARRIRSVLSPYPADGVHWIDSGDYHYITLFFLEKMESSFTLFLFDNHPDNQDTAFGEILSCGSWVKHALELSMLEAVYPGWHPPYPPAALPLNPLKRGKAYISIDKDVLDRRYARTDWDQGTLTLDELIDAVKAISASYDVVGVDICGELSEHKGAGPEDLTINARTNEILRDLFINLKM